MKNVVKRESLLGFFFSILLLTTGFGEENEQLKADSANPSGTQQAPFNPDEIDKSPMWEHDLRDYPNQHSIFIGRVTKMVSEKSVVIINESREANFIYSKADFHVSKVVHWRDLAARPSSNSVVSCLIPRLVTDRDRLIDVIEAASQDNLYIFKHSNVAGISPMQLAYTLPIEDEQKVMKLLKEVVPSNASGAGSK